MYTILETNSTYLTSGVAYINIKKHDYKSLKAEHLSKEYLDILKDICISIQT